MITQQQIGDFDAKLRKILGVNVPDVPLAPKIESEETVGDVKRMLVRYDVADGERIGAYLLIPLAQTPQDLPAIMAIHQHGGNFKLGKSEPAGLSDNPTFHYGLDLAKRGYVVLCPDQLAFEERVPSPNEADDWNERFEATRLFMEGSSLQAKYVADLVKGLDYLCSLPFVNSNRIGCIGHSLGGQETLWLTWFDSRIKAAASSCGFAMMSAIVRERINHNMAIYVPGFLTIGDVDMIAAAISPRPFLFTAGNLDGIFPIDSVRHIAQFAKAVYSQAGATENTQYVEFDGAHGFPDDVKKQAYEFLDKHLKT